VLAMGVLTAFELISGKTAADAVTGGHSGSTSTVAEVLGRDHHKKQQSPVPATTPSASTPASNAPSEAPNGTEAPSSGPATTDTSTAPSAPPAPTETTTPEPTATDTQNTDGGAGGDQNNIAPPATQQSQGTE